MNHTFLLHPFDTDNNEYAEVEKDRIRSDDKPNENLGRLCAAIRKELFQAKCVAPYLIQIHDRQHVLPLYLDALDDGWKLMLFPDTNAYERALLYRRHENPELMFAEALVIVFLYEDREISVLLLYDHHNLCYQLRPGHLPETICETTQIWLYEALRIFYQCLQAHTKMPELQKGEILILTEHDMNIADYRNDNKKEFPYEEDGDLLNKRFLHTNEQLHLAFQIKMEENTVQTKKFDVLLCAGNQHFHKEYRLRLNAIDELEQDVCDILLLLCRQRGVMEAIHIYSYHLYHIIQPLCQKLHASSANEWLYS